MPQQPLETRCHAKCRRTAYLARLRSSHPDKGGSSEAFHDVQAEFQKRSKSSDHFLHEPIAAQHFHAARPPLDSDALDRQMLSDCLRFMQDAEDHARRGEGAAIDAAHSPHQPLRHAQARPTRQFAA